MAFICEIYEGMHLKFLPISRQNYTKAFNLFFQGRSPGKVKAQGISGIAGYTL